VDHFRPTEDETAVHGILALVARVHDRIRSEVGDDPNQEEKTRGKTGVEAAAATQVN